MQEHNITPEDSLFDRPSEDTNIVCFLDAVKYLHPLTPSVILRLAERFSISPECLVILIEFCRNGGGLQWN